MRVFSGSLATETNTFSPLPTGLASFKESRYFPAGQHPDHMTLFAGPLWAARQRSKEQGWQLFEGLVTDAQPGGIITRHAYETLREELLTDLRMALPVDMVVLGLHGAMVADGYDDCEGDLLQRVRDIVGLNVVVGAELDPHCHLSAAMVAHADLLIAFKEYPHTDILERAFELVDLCAAMVEKKIKPIAAAVDCEMIVTLRTPREPARGFIDRIKALESTEGVLSVSIAHGFSWGDVPDMGTKVLVYTNDAPEQASLLARQLADELIGMREEFTTPCLDIDEALDNALSIKGGPVVLADTADNAGGGAAGDSTFILRRLVERGIQDAIVGPLWDPLAVRIAFEAGEGAKLAMRLGGKVSPLSGAPLDLECTVKALHPSLVMTGLSGTPTAMGPCALIHANGIDIVLSTQRNQAFNTDLFTQLECDLGAKKMIIVKSAQHFYESFSKIAKHTIYVDTPGSVPLNLLTLPFQKLKHPKWPITIAAK